MTDFNRLRTDELASISEFVNTLTDEQWNQQTLCEGWRVRDIVSHMSLGYTTPVVPLLTALAKRRFNVPKTSAEESIAFANEHSIAELKSIFESIHRDNVRKGISKVIRAKEGLLDHLVHHQDMRRPLGMPRQVPDERLLAALDVAPGINSFVGSKKRASGLRLQATDLDWSHGDGPEVKGTGEALLLAMTGRASVLNELTGEGLATLRGRLAA